MLASLMSVYHIKPKWKYTRTQPCISNAIRISRAMLRDSSLEPGAKTRVEKVSKEWLFSNTTWYLVERKKCKVCSTLFLSTLLFKNHITFLNISKSFLIKYYLSYIELLLQTVTFRNLSFFKTNLSITSPAGPNSNLATSPGKFLCRYLYRADRKCVFFSRWLLCI